MKYGTDILYTTPDQHSESESKNVITPPGLQGRQVTVDEIHPNWQDRPKGRTLVGDIGGEFSSDMTRVSGSNPNIGWSGSATYFNGTTPWNRDWFVYRGPVLPLNPSGLSFPPSAASSDSLLKAKGTEAIARCKPTNSSADFLTGLTEMVREGLPNLTSASLWKDQTLTAKKAGGEYLNIEFGWKPLVDEVVSSASAISRYEAILAQYERDAGRVVRRRYEFPPEKQSETVVYASGVRPYTPVSHALMTDGSPASGQVIRSRETTKRRWFSGAFTYYLNSGDSARSEMGRAYQESKKVLGLAPTPEVLWNLSPWSWLVDWFTNAGDVISNMSDWAVDGLVMRYGYIMEFTSVTDTYTFVGKTGYRSGIRPSNLVLTTTSKRRLKASPYGFGITWDGLSSTQAAILAALGLTRSGK